jgi:plasmid stability protein
MQATTRALTIRNIPIETHRALKHRAIQKGNSMEAEIRAILEEAVRPEGRIKVGAELAKIGKRFAKELAEIDFDALRDKTPTRGADFE